MIKQFIKSANEGCFSKQQFKEVTVQKCH